jgi:hypothetical protein
MSKNKIDFTEYELSGSLANVEKSMQQIRMGYSSKNKEILKRYREIWRESQMTKATKQSIKLLAIMIAECRAIFDSGVDDAS